MENKENHISSASSKNSPQAANEAREQGPPSPTPSPDMALIIAQRLEAKKQQIEEMEAKLDKKMSDFKAFMKETEVAGRAVVAQLESEEEKCKKAAMKLLEGSGLNPFN